MFSGKEDDDEPTKIFIIDLTIGVHGPFGSIFNVENVMISIYSSHHIF